MANEFAKVFKKKSEPKQPSCSDISSLVEQAKNEIAVDKPWQFKYVTPNTVLKAIGGLKSSGASGPDGLTSKFLKAIENELALLLAQMYTMMVITRDYSSQLVHAKTTPIHKRKDTPKDRT